MNLAPQMSLKISNYQSKTQKKFNQTFSCALYAFWTFWAIWICHNYHICVIMMIHLRRQLKMIATYNIRSNNQLVMWVLTFLLSALIVITQTQKYAEVPWLYLDTAAISTFPWTTISWRKALPSVVQHGLALSRYWHQNNYMTTYHAEMTSINNTGCLLTVVNHGPNSNLFLLNFRILVVTQNIPTVQLLNPQFNYLPQGSLIPSLDLYAVSSKFTFATGSEAWVRVYLYWIKCYPVTITRYTVTYAGEAVPSSNNIKITLTAAIPNYFVAVKFTVLIMRKQTSYAFFTSYSLTGTYSPYVFQPDFGVPNDRFGLALFDNQCTISLVTMDFSANPSMSSRVQFGVFFIVFNITQTSNIYQYTFNVDCLGACSITKFINNLPDMCQLCTAYIEYCQSCSSNSTCHFCYLGDVVIGGCTKEPGCLAVGQRTGSTFAISYCTLCNASEFQLNSRTSKCECLQGWIAGVHCTTVIGCTTAEDVNGSILCIACDLFNHFEHNSTTHLCECVQGYTLVNGSCQEICGDGLVFAAECDDGNTEGGDGCSGSCKVQVNYRCDSSSTPSSCKYIGHFLAAELIDTQRNGPLNQGIFTFSFTPQLVLLRKFDISAYFQFSCPSVQLGSIEWASQGNDVVAIVEFLTDLEAGDVEAVFAFNQTFVKHPPVTLKFQVKSKGIQLRVAKQTQRIALIESFFLAIGFAALALLFVGPWVHKMVGVELIYALQMVYYIHFTAKPYTLPISSLRPLSLLGLNTLYWQQANQNFKVAPSFEKIPFSAEYLRFSLLLLGSLPLLGLLGLCVYCLLLRLAPEAEETLKKVAERVYRCLLCPAALGSLLPLMLFSATLLSRSATPSGQPLSSMLCLLGLLFVNAVVFFEALQEIGAALAAFRFRLASPSYVPGYFAFWVALFMVLTVGVRQEIGACAVVQIGLAFLMLCWHTARRPYYAVLDNVGIVFNYALVVAFSLYVQLRNRAIVPCTEQADLMCCFVLIIFCLACIVLSFARIVTEICNRSNNSQIIQFVPQKQRKLQPLLAQQAAMRITAKRLMSSKSSLYKQSLLKNWGATYFRSTEPNKQFEDAQMNQIKNKLRQCFRMRTNIEQSLSKGQQPDIADPSS